MSLYLTVKPKQLLQIQTDIDDVKNNGVSSYTNTKFYHATCAFFKQ